MLAHQLISLLVLLPIIFGGMALMKKSNVPGLICLDGALCGNISREHHCIKEDDLDSVRACRRLATSSRTSLSH